MRMARLIILTTARASTCAAAFGSRPGQQPHRAGLSAEQARLAGFRHYDRRGKHEESPSATSVSYGPSSHVHHSTSDRDRGLYDAISPTSRALLGFNLRGHFTLRHDRNVRHDPLRARAQSCARLGHRVISDVAASAMAPILRYTRSVVLCTHVHTMPTPGLKPGRIRNRVRH